MTDTNKLREKIAEKGFKYGFIAQKLGITAESLRKKIENDNQFKAGEIKILAELLCFSPEEITCVFFAL